MNLSSESRKRLAMIRRRVADVMRASAKRVAKNSAEVTAMCVWQEAGILVRLVLRAGESKPMAGPDAARVKEIKKSITEAYEYYGDEIKQNAFGPIRMGIFGDMQYLLNLYDRLTQRDPEPEVAIDEFDAVSEPD